MSNKKISALSSATTPLTGSEIVPINQSSVTDSVSVANLTAGRAVSAASLALTSSPLPVTSGGTGTATALTAGSIAFAGASGVLNQDNANLFWDNTGKRLGIGTNTPPASTAATVYANSGTAMFVQIYAIAPTLIQFANSQGNGGAITMISGGGTLYGTSSDYRLKENIQPMTGALDRVAQLNPVTYNWKVDGSASESFIAHELAEVCPQAVHGEKDGTKEEEYEITPAIKDEKGNIVTPAEMGTRVVPAYQNIDNSHVVPLLAAAIKELKSEFDAYKATHP